MFDALIRTPKVVLQTSSASASLIRRSALFRVSMRYPIVRVDECEFVPQIEEFEKQLEVVNSDSASRFLNPPSRPTAVNDHCNSQPSVTPFCDLGSEAALRIIVSTTTTLPFRGESV